MRDYKSLAHTRWDCKHHIVFIPKYRKKVIYGNLRSYIGEIFHELAGHRESRIEEGHMMGDHIHMCISIPPKYPVSKVAGYIKGKSAIMIAQRFSGKVRNYKGESFWARDISFQPLDWMKKWCESIFEPRMSEINISTNRTYRFSGAFCPFKGLTRLSPGYAGGHLTKPR